MDKYRANPKGREKLNEGARRRKAKLKAENPIKYKAIHMTGGLQLGKGGATRLEAMIIEAIGKPCEYCSKELLLSNLSLDHKIPWFKSRKKTKKEADILNTEGNLHIICLSCNRSKGNMHHKDYKALIDFLESYPSMKQIVIAKLKGSNFMYRK